MANILRLGFSQIFPLEKKLSYSEYVKNISSKTILQEISLINLKQFIDGVSSESQMNLLEKILSNLNSAYANALKSKFENQIRFGNTKIFNRVSNLKIIENEFENFRDRNDEGTIGEIKLNFLKAYLVINDNLDYEQHHLPSIENKPKEKRDIFEFVKSFFTPAHLPYTEFIMGENDFFYQIEMFFDLVEFLETDENLSGYFKDFLKKKSIESSDEYLYRSLEIIIIYFKMGKEGKNVLNFENTNENDRPAIFYSLSSKEYSSYKDKNLHKERSDFSSIRDKPLFQIEKDQLLILDLKFLLNKIYKSLYFEFLRFIANEKSNEKNVFEDTKSNISSNQLHKSFNYTIRNIFESKRSILIPEKEGLIDCYYRKKKNVFLFEFKDELIPIKTKYDPNYEKILQGLNEKFVWESKNQRAKGVTQLKNAIENLNNKYSEYDNIETENIKESEIAIFPVLVYTDSTLNFPGFNDTLDQEFKKRIAKINNLKFKRVHGLILLNYKFIVDFGKYLKEEKISLTDLFIKYYEEIERKKINSVFANPNRMDDFLNLLTSPDLFFRDFINKKGLFPEERGLDRLNNLIKKFNPK